MNQDNYSISVPRTDLPRINSNTAKALMMDQGSAFDPNAYVINDRYPDGINEPDPEHRNNAIVVQLLLQRLAHQLDDNPRVRDILAGTAKSYTISLMIERIDGEPEVISSTFETRGAL